MKKLLVVVLALFAIQASSLAQKTIKGKVSDEDGVGVPNANVVQSGGARKGVQTDKDGNFSLSIKEAGKVSITVSSVGYGTKVVNVTGDEVSVILEKKVSVQDEVVVVGYQTIKRKEIAGATGAVTAEQIKDVPASANAAEALAGRATGVQVVSSEGGPGAEFDIKVRGGTSITQDNTPLYIVDGIPVEGALSLISPQDIQSFDILKDAAATAIYGSRGANGVIVITTKGGKNNKKLSVTYNAFVGVKSLANKLDVMSPVEFVKYQYERINGNLRSSQDSGRFASKYGQNIWTDGHVWDSVNAYQDVEAVDWQEKLFGRNALQHSHNVVLTGGNKQTSFNLSLTYNNEEGILLGTDFTKRLATLKLEHKVTSKLKLGTTIRLSGQSLDGAGVSGDDTKFSRLRHIIKYVPFNNFKFQEDENNPLLDEDPNANSGGLGITNPYVYTLQDLKRKNNTVMNFTGYAQYSLAKWLTFKTTVGVENRNQFTKSFSDSATPYSRNDGNIQPIAGIDSNQRFSITNSNVLSFNSASIKGKFKEKNNLQIILGQETIVESEEASSNVYRLYPNGADYNKVWDNYTGSYPGAVLAPNFPVFGKQERSLVSFFGKMTYSRQSKYFASFSYRADGSSKFAPGRQWGYFPAASLAWSLSKENFMSKVNFINDVRLRASYGASGNNKIQDYAYIPTFSYNSANGYGLLDVLNSGMSFYYPNTSFLANGLIKWETTISKNVGIDFGLFKNALLFTVDLYENSSNDLLIKNRVPATTGYQEQFQNVGSTVNKGVEIQVTAPKLVNSKNFNWSSTFNISFNKNEVKSLGGLPELNAKSGIISKNPADYKIRPGQPLGQVWGYINDGWFTGDDFIAGSFNAANNTFTVKPTTLVNNTGVGVVQPGSIKFKDLDGNDTLDTRDQTVIGNTNPKFFGGFNNQFSYKNFDLSVFVNFVYGNQVYNANRTEFSNSYQADQNFIKDMEGRWKTVDENGNYITDLAALDERNKNATMWKPTTLEFFPAMSAAIEDASFLRLNNVTLGYTVHPRSKLFKSLRLYATGNNIAVITNYTGFDPEVSAKRSVLTPGVDYSAYPKSRSYILGLNVGF